MLKHFPVPNSFLGWICATPAIQYFELPSIPFLGLSKLFLSATNLVDSLHILHSGYISPEAMGQLPLLTSLRVGTLSPQSQSPRSYPDRASQRQPPPTRPITSALTCFNFKAGSVYLDHILSSGDRFPSRRQSGRYHMKHMWPLTTALSASDFHHEQISAGEGPK
jgi:hypothetical protein